MNLTDLGLCMGMVTKSFIVGLPASGKTTFLGALAYTLVNSNAVSTQYQMYNIEDMSYLNSIAGIWSSCDVVERTNLGQYEKNVLFLKDKLENEIELIIPDLSGEDFEDVVKNRTMTDAMYKDIQESSNIFLFINPDMISKQTLIKDISPEHRQETEELESDSDEESNKNDQYEIHEQAQYVMLLQDIGRIRKDCTRMKVIVSAWDAYDCKATPQDLLEEKMPLLWQYLITNEKLFECEYWGISAQGGDLNDPAKKDELLDCDDPIDRIIIVNSEGKRMSNDLTMLLK